MKVHNITGIVLIIYACFYYNMHGLGKIYSDFQSFLWIILVIIFIIILLAIINGFLESRNKEKPANDVKLGIRTPRHKLERYIRTNKKSK